MDLLREAQISGIKAQGEFTIKAIQSTSSSGQEKAKAITKVIIDTQLAIIKVMECK